jgi:SAM-dependent methyltransferase
MSESSAAARIPPSRPDALPPLPLVHDYLDGIRLLESWIDRHYKQEPLRILEAGCGNRWPLKLTVPYTLTAVDIDANALEIRKAKMRDLDQVFVGDLRTADLVPEGQFDVIYNSFVLEHVQGAEQVLDNFFRWLKPGGLLVVRFPDRNSVYGFLTRITPFWSHVLLKRYVYGSKTAGKPGFDPYPTVYDRVVSRQGMHEYCRRNGHGIKDETGYANYLPRKAPLNTLSRLLVRIVSLLSMGRLDWRHNNLTFVIQKSLKRGQSGSE